MKFIALALAGAVAACSSPPAPRQAEAPAAAEPEPAPAPEPSGTPPATESTDDIEVQLPDSESPAAPALLVTISSDGAIAIDGKAVADADLVSAFKSYPPETRVVIKADPAASHARVVAVLEAARDGGLSKMALATD